MNKKTLVLLLMILFNNLCFASDKKIIFLVPEYIPYMYTDPHGDFKGIGIETVKKIMKDIDIEYIFKSSPNHDKAFMDVKLGKADGVFLASQNDERDELCVFSSIVFPNNWYWFVLANSDINPKDKSFKKNAKIGTILNTNHQTWLKENGYNIVSTPKDMTAPPEILKLKRVDAFFMSELVFWSGVPENEKFLFKSIFEMEHPLGIYISKKFLEANPGFLTQLNKSIEKNKTH